ncbi:hypothetical protein BRW65_00405 [Mycobacterium paraffinicum]|uniref:Uncharacterized protein n=1 Tax=Mycobacterium paraffinicum TaxID=53378 RepID=A0A1Q4I201_9MYCO|nr:hypothetical protein BRW65_00405 [Mycobacterium paraffinicum]
MRPKQPWDAAKRAWEVAPPAISSGVQQPTGPPPAGQLGMLIGMQLTEVVETANASSNAKNTLFPLVIAEKRTPERGSA